MTSRTARTILRLISLAPYFIYVITSAYTVISFPITRPSSISSPLICQQTMQRDYRTIPLALKSYSSLQSLTPMIMTRYRPASIISGKSNDSLLCLHASKTRSIDKSSPTDTAKTLYEILGVPPDAEKADIKRAYVALARQTHPDAIRQKKNDGEEDDGAEPMESFDTIARAYRTLTTPLERKRYDRKLRAKEFTNDVEQAIDNFGESDLFRKVVNPILRRGAVTTRKGWNEAIGASNGGEDGKTNNIVEGDDGVQTEKYMMNSIDDVVQAGKEGWKQADQLDIIEESREIEEKTKEKEQAALEINDTLSDMMMSRIRLSLKTPNAPLTSLDALRCLDGMNTIDSVTFIDRTVRLRHTTSHDIELLSQTEKECEMKDQGHRMAAEDLENTKDKIHRTKKDLEDAKEAEIRAWKVLDEAVVLVSSLKKEAEESERSLLMKENLYRRTKVDAGAMVKEVNKRRETVRGSLLRKEKCMNERGNENDADEARMGTNEDPSNKHEDVSYLNRMEEVERYLKEENDLLGKIASLEKEASQLREKSRALIEKAIDGGRRRIDD